MEAYDLDQHEEDLTLMLHAWPDIEEALIRSAKAAMEPANQGYSEQREAALAESVRHAFRVEVQVTSTFLEHGLGYVLFYDVNDYAARQAAAALNDHASSLNLLIYKYARGQGPRGDLAIQIVPSGKPIEGQVCPRVMTSPVETPDLRDLPEPEPPRTAVPLVSRGLHKLTPIEAPFYDALQETDLIFAVQPRVQGDRTYRPDFIVFYGGKAIVVELDGHEGHKTKEQRVDDAQRELWFQKKGMSVLRWTGTQVAADAGACVDQLMAVLRGTEARP